MNPIFAPVLIASSSVEPTSSPCPSATRMASTFGKSSSLTGLSGFLMNGFVTMTLPVGDVNRKTDHDSHSILTAFDCADAWPAHAVSVAASAPPTTQRHPLAIVSSPCCGVSSPSGPGGCRALRRGGPRLSRDNRGQEPNVPGLLTPTREPSLPRTKHAHASGVKPSTPGAPVAETVAAVRCCIAGGGPAGMMLGLLLARAGVDVLVLEKHADFLRDFRGDTIHPSTLEVLHELGLLERLLTLPHQKVPRINGQFGDLP